MEILQEVYFGKEALAPIQKQFTKLRDKLASQRVTSTTNLDPEILKFNRMVENFFGFRSYSLYIQPDYTPNAYAFPVDTLLTNEDKQKIRASLIANPEGFKYDPKKLNAKITLIMAINIGLMNNESYTDEELIGIMLHEIGHGFFEAVTDKDGEYTISRKIIAALQYALSCARAHAKNGNGNRINDNIINKELSAISDWVDGIGESIKGFFSKKKSRSFSESMYDNMKGNRLRYTNEKFADSFAAMYGYGAEVQTALVKMGQNLFDDYYGGPRVYPRIVETLKMYRLYIDDLIAFSLNIQNEHPGDLARVNYTIQFIKRELSKEALDPKIKTQLVDQLNQLEKLIEDYKNYPRDKDSMRILRLYNIKLYEKFGGDRREKVTDNEALWGYVDKRYEDLMNDNKK